MTEIETCTSFLKTTFAKTGMTNAVIAVSGGIDSAVSLSLLARSLDPSHIFPILLPYGSQNMVDARAICEWNHIPIENITELNIQPIADTIATTLSVGSDELIRKGNVMARARMVAVFDLAKQKNALVVGTENKSEHYLGYFTRFGDGASDIEPIVHLYKTQIRKIATELGLPSVFLSKEPSAGLWENQTDEQELGFSYLEADQVLTQLIDQGKSVDQIQVSGVEQSVVEKICRQVEKQAFKRVVPYLISG